MSIVSPATCSWTSVNPAPRSQSPAPPGRGSGCAGPRSLERRDVEVVPVQVRDQHGVDVVEVARAPGPARRGGADRPGRGSPGRSTRRIPSRSMTSAEWPRKSSASGELTARSCGRRPDTAGRGGTARGRATATRGWPARPSGAGAAGCRRSAGASSTGSDDDEDDADRVLGLAQGGLARIDLEREDRGQARLHLRDRVALEDVDRHRPVLRVAEHRGLLLVLVA